MSLRKLKAWEDAGLLDAATAARISDWEARHTFARFSNRNCAFFLLAGLLFGIEIESCARCGARLKLVASIEDPGVIALILAHRARRNRSGRRPPPGQQVRAAWPWLVVMCATTRLRRLEI